MGNIIINSENLDAMLEKFFDGDTSCAEEKALEAYFSSGAALPSAYEPYREMFGWYASGMNPDALPAPTPAPRRKPWRRILWWGSVAAVAAIVFSIVPLRDTSTINSLQPYNDCFVVRDGKMTTGDTEIRAEIEAALLEGECLDKEIDMRISMLDYESFAIYDDSVY